MGVVAPRWRCLAAAAALATLAAASVAGAAPSADEIRRAAAAVLEGGDYQVDLPREDPRRQTAGSGAAASGGRAQTQAPIRPPSADVPAEGPQDVGVWLAWVLGVAAAALVVFYLWNRAPSMSARRDRAVPPAADGAVARETSQRAVSDPLAEADSLARRGEYGEAIHAILLVVLERLRGRLGFVPRSSLTSREIMSRASLAEGAGAALSLIVRLAELSHFGGRAPSEADYRSCRESYRQLAAPRAGEAT